MIKTFSQSKLLGAAVLAAALLTACSQKPEDASEVAQQQLVEATQKAEEAAARAEAAQKALEEAQAKAAAESEQAAADAKREAAARKRSTAQSQTASNSYTEARPKPVCQDCGTISAITPVKVKGSGSGIGAVAGAIAGIAVGNQIGDGKGTDVAKVVGAIGGAYAGNQAEKAIRAETVYDVTVRLDNGSSSTVRVADASSVSVGSRVRVSGNNLEKL